MASYEQAVTALYRAPHESFVAERTRLAAELKQTDKLAAARLAKLGRPSISAWAVNQLWWHSRAAFEQLFEAAAQLRAGKLTANAEHRKALAKLMSAAPQLLKEAGHGSADATLRRVSMSLSGLAAIGSFDPDPPGALSKDRDPPGFDAFGSTSFEPPAKLPSKREPAKSHESERAAQASATEARAAEAAAKQRAAEARAEHQHRLRELQAAVDEAKHTLARREQEQARVAEELASAERQAQHAREALESATARLTEAKREAGASARAKPFQ